MYYNKRCKQRIEFYLLQLLNKILQSKIINNYKKIYNFKSKKQDIRNTQMINFYKKQMKYNILKL